MANRRLNIDELAQANELLKMIRSKIQSLASGDKELVFAFRRKIYKELTYDERGKPQHRKKLKELKRKEQNGLCTICGLALPDAYAVLDRYNAVDGYTQENTRLIHKDCDTDVQKSRGYA